LERESIAFPTQGRLRWSALCVAACLSVGARPLTAAGARVIADSTPTIRIQYRSCRARYIRLRSGSVFPDREQHDITGPHCTTDSSPIFIAGSGADALFNLAQPPRIAAVQQFRWNHPDDYRAVLATNCTCSGSSRTTSERFPGSAAILTGPGARFRSNTIDPTSEEPAFLVAAVQRSSEQAMQPHRSKRSSAPVSVISRAAARCGPPPAFSFHRSATGRLKQTFTHNGASTGPPTRQSIGQTHQYGASEFWPRWIPAQAKSHRDGLNTCTVPGWMAPDIDVSRGGVDRRSIGSPTIARTPRSFRILGLADLTARTFR